MSTLRARALTDLAFEIERQQNAKRDFIADTRQVRVLDDGKTIAVAHQGEFRLSDHALGQVGERTGVPMKYLRRMQDEAPKLLAENVNHWFSAAAEQLPAVHPETPEIHTVNQTLWPAPVTRSAAGKTARNAVIVSSGRIDRSPCGTGTCARLAIMHAKGEIAVGEPFVHESIIGTKFTGEMVATAEIDSRPGVRCAISGRAWITAFHQYVLDPSDPFPTGYRLGDTWPGG